MALSVDKSALRRYIERSLQDLPALPPVVAKIIELTERPDSTATELDRLISSDPAMAAKVLRVVNSAYYGLSNQVGTTAHAIVILGFRQIQNLVLSMAAMSLVKMRARGMAETQLRFWRHSYGCAAATGCLAQLKSITPAERDKAVVGSLLHDIGVLFLYSSFTDMYSEVLKYASDRELTLEESECALLGIDHGEVGDILTTAWHFPDYLRELIRCHQGPFETTPPVSLALVHAADVYTRRAGFATVESPQVPLDKTVAAWLSLSPSQELAVQATIEKKVHDAADLFGLI